MTGQVLPLRENQLAKIIEWADKLGGDVATEVRKDIQLIKQVSGDFPKLDQLVNIWGVQAHKPMTDASEAVTNAEIALAYIWESPAAKGYHTYLDAMQAATRQFIGIAAGSESNGGGMMQHLQDVRQHLLDQWSALVIFVANCFRNLLHTEGAMTVDVAQLVEQLAKDAATAGISELVSGSLLAFAAALLRDIADAIGQFIKDFAEWLTNTADKLMKSTEDMEKAASAAVALTVPDPDAPDLGDPRNWQQH